MRVVLVCPYSLSLPGGVQGQVLGLARTLREQGISAKVLGPCDGPPPEPGVISVGSQRLAGRQRVGGPPGPRPDGHPPHARGPGRRTARRPPPPRAAGARPGADGPAGRQRARWWGRSTPPAGSPPTSGCGRRCGPWPAASACGRPSPPRPGPWPSAGWAAPATSCPTESRSSASPRPSPWPAPETPGGSGRAILFVGRHEPRKGLEVLLKAFAGLDTDAVLWVAGEGPETAALAATAAAGNVRVAGPHLRPGAGRADADGGGVLRPVPPRRVLRRGPARGDGGRHPRGRLRHLRLPRRRPRRPGGGPRPGRRPRRPGRRAPAGARRSHSWPAASSRPARPGRPASPWSAWPPATSTSTRPCWPVRRSTAPNSGSSVPPI